ncbi:P-loop containing nucleoside triphosphate hydrolase protein, partial [Fomitopsis betulina]
LPTIPEIRQRTQAVLKRLPCLWQAEVCREQLRGEKDILCIAPTGLGKPLTFWMPLLFREDGIQIVVTPLNLLGTKNVAELASHGFRACEVRAETATPKLFQAREIEDGKYCVVIANPEELMKDGGGFEKLWKKEHFTSRIISMVWDEAHCISTWNSFRADYKKAYRIRYMLPKLRFLLASATFDTEIKNDVFKTMHISPLTCAIFQHSNDRPNVHIEVHRIQHALHTYADLDFIFPPNWKPGDDLPRFLIFFDSIKESISAAEKLQSQLGASTRHKIVWFNS